MKIRMGSVLLGLTTLIGACDDPPSQGGEDRMVVDVTVSTPAWLDAPEIHTATVEPRRTVVVATRIAGTIENVRVDVGDRVRAGDALVTIDGSELTAAVAAAATQAEMARKTYDRISSLASDGAASAQEHDQALTALRTAEARLDEARARSRYTELSAPFDGFVVSRAADAGSLAAPGQPLLELASVEANELVAELPPRLWGSVAEGVVLRLDHPETGWSGSAVVIRRSPRLATGTRRFRVELRVTDSDQLPLPGSRVQLLLGGSQDPSLWLPMDAVFRRGQLTGAYTVEGGRLRLRWIRTGLSDGDRIEVLAGLTVDAVVVRSPTSDLSDGALVGRLTRATWPIRGEAAR